MDEQYQISRRYAAFKVDELCKLVSSLPSIQSLVSSIDKLEGGFNKALMMRMENGKEVVVKIPFPNSVSPQCTTESEAAVLDYGRNAKSSWTISHTEAFSAFPDVSTCAKCACMGLRQFESCWSRIPCFGKGRRQAVE